MPGSPDYGATPFATDSEVTVYLGAEYAIVRDRFTLDAALFHVDSAFDASDDTQAGVGFSFVF